MRVYSIIFLLVVGTAAVTANPRLTKRQAAEEPPVAPDTAAAAADAAAPAAPAEPVAPTGRQRPQPVAGPAPRPVGPAPRPVGPAPRPVGPAPAPQGPSSGLTLADGADIIVGNIQDTFSCQDKIYGYYADVDNGCKIFHVCVPVQDENGQQTSPSLRFSFFCNNGTIFNQEALVCDHQDNVDCSTAPNFYNVNEEFGKIEPRSGPAPVPVARNAPAPVDTRAPAARPAPPPPPPPPQPQPAAPEAPAAPATETPKEGEAAPTAA